MGIQTSKMKERLKGYLKDFFYNPFAILLVGIAIAISFGLAASWLHVEEIDHVAVMELKTQQKVSGTDGDITTSYQYLVLTDKGVFEISPQGIYSASHCWGKVKEGDTINIVTRGFQLDYIGCYRFIVDVK